MARWSKVKSLGVEMSPLEVAVREAACDFVGINFGIFDVGFAAFELATLFCVQWS